MDTLRAAVAAVTLAVGLVVPGTTHGARVPRCGPDEVIVRHQRSVPGRCSPIGDLPAVIQQAAEYATGYCPRYGEAPGVRWNRRIERTGGYVHIECRGR